MEIACAPTKIRSPSTRNSFAEIAAPTPKPATLILPFALDARMVDGFASPLAVVVIA